MSFRYIRKFLVGLIMPAALLMLPACHGILGGIYDEPPVINVATQSGRLYVDASDWLEWHYISFPELAAASAGDADFNTSSLWKTFPVPVKSVSSGEIFTMPPERETPGIYTYWYDVFGAGLSRNHFVSFVPTEAQEEPEEWAIAVHRNNVRTNGGACASTPYKTLESIPEGTDWLFDLDFREDSWNETDVWVRQERMLLGEIGNQGIAVNAVLSKWLSVSIPPVPPVFSLNGDVFVIRLKDGTYAALRLDDYMDGTGKKCCLTISYRYPIQ